MSEKEKQQLVSEVNILREITHQNIVKYYDRIIDKEKQLIYIVMEFCEGGDMAKLIKSCKRKKNFIPENILWKVIYQMASALHECHNRPQGRVLHRDLKPGNIFLDKSHNVKLGDFGLSRVMGEESIFAYTHVGTPYYMSPEQIAEQRYDNKSDIWSFGCIIYEIAALHPPFQARYHVQLAQKINECKIDPLPDKYSKELQDAIFSMIKINPNQRPSTDDILQLSSIKNVMQDKMKRENAAMRSKEKELNK